MKKQANQDGIEVTIETPGGLNSQTGKSEEIEILHRITNRFMGTQTYLNSLFTDDLLEFFMSKVKNDFCPNIMAEYNAELENNRNLTEDLHKQSQNNLDLIKSMSALRENAMDDINSRDKMIGKKESYILELSNALGDVRRDFISVKCERDTLAETVRDLKVMLFDLQNKAA